MKVHRTKHTANFTIAPNAILREERMSEMARLILLRLLSNADDFNGATALKMWEDARKIRGDAAPGKRAFLHAFNEMEAFGYLVRTKVREGSKWVTRVDVYDTPQNLPEEEPGGDSLGLPGIGKPEGEKPEPGKSESGQSSKRTTQKDVSRRTTSSSSAEVEDITHEATPPAVEKKTKRSPEAIVQERTGCTDDEAAAVVDFIEQQGDSGQPIRRIIPWVTGRADRDLARDLAHVRRFAESPPADAACSEHGVTLAPGYCSACEADMAAGDFETVRKILARDGATARPDLARRLGAPHVPAQGTTGAPSIQDIQRAEKRARGGYTPYRNPANQDEYDGSLLPTPRPQGLSGALAPIVTAEQIRSGAAELRV